MNLRVPRSGEAAKVVKKYLASQGIEVKHSQALELVARLHGYASWQAMQADDRFSQAPALKPQGCDEYEFVGPRGESVWVGVENISVYIKREHEGVVVDLFAKGREDEESMGSTYAFYTEAQNDVEDDTDPQDSRPRCVMPGSIPARVNVCASSAQEQEIHIDVLQWFKQHSYEDLEILVEDGLHNTSASDDVVLWLKEHASDEALREELQRLLAHCKWAQETNPSLLGVTADIDKSAVAAFVRAKLEEGEVYGLPTLRILGILDGDDVRRPSKGSSRDWFLRYNKAKDEWYLTEVNHGPEGGRPADAVLHFEWGGDALAYLVGEGEPVRVHWEGNDAAARRALSFEVQQDGGLLKTFTQLQQAREFARNMAESGAGGVWAVVTNDCVEVALYLHID